MSKVEAGFLCIINVVTDNCLKVFNGETSWNAEMRIMFFSSHINVFTVHFSDIQHKLIFKLE